MRTRLLSIVGALLLVTAGVSAQDANTTADAVQKDVARTTTATNPDIPLVNQIDLGVRGTAFGPGSDITR